MSSTGNNEQHEIARLAALQPYERDREREHALRDLRGRYLACSHARMDDEQPDWHAYAAEKQAIERRFAAAAAATHHPQMDNMDKSTRTS